VTFSTIYLSSNGAGNNIQVGDDVYLGDVSLAYTLGLRGQDATGSNQGYIKFGSGYLFGFNGSNLVYNNNRILTTLDLADIPTLSGSNTFTGPVNSFGAIAANYITNNYACTETKTIAGGSGYGTGMTMSTKYNSTSPEIGLRSSFSGSYNSMGLTNVNAEFGFIISQASNSSPMDVYALGLTNISHRPNEIVSSGTISGNSFTIINSASDLTLTLPTPGSASAGHVIKIAVRASGANGHRIYPQAANTIYFSGMYGTSYNTHTAHPSGIPSGVPCLLRPGLYEFAAVSSTEWVLSSGPKTYP
jgi:hypothetical protein